MTATPRVSFIVLSYNYEQYVGQTIRSILAQTFEDLEIVVVDDASTDRSREVIASFRDPRVRLHVNERNLGGGASYNIAISLARGEFLANLDTDDWIEPRKTEAQLVVLDGSPSVDVVGSYVSIIGPGGDAHERAPELEQYFNRPIDLDDLDPWIVQNVICRSSTIMRRSVHERVGPDDPTMARALDYELWTRALRAGCRFHVVPEKLTALRFHEGNVTFSDPVQSFREVAWVQIRNVVPLIEERGVWPALAQLVERLTAHEQFGHLPPAEGQRVLGFLFAPPAVESFAAFERLLATPNAPLEAAGRRVLALTRSAAARVEAERLRADALLEEARDHYRGLAERHQREVRLLEEAREHQRGRADECERELRWWQGEANRWEQELRWWQGEADRWEQELRWWQGEANRWEQELRWWQADAKRWQEEVRQRDRPADGIDATK